MKKAICFVLLLCSISSALMIPFFDMSLSFSKIGWNLRVVVRRTVAPPDRVVQDTGFVVEPEIDVMGTVGATVSLLSGPHILGTTSFCGVTVERGLTEGDSLIAAGHQLGGDSERYVAIIFPCSYVVGTIFAGIHLAIGC